MPTLSIDLSANQAQRVAAALGVSSMPEAVNAVKAMLKERVKAYEASTASQSASTGAQSQVDTDFGGF